MTPSPQVTALAWDRPFYTMGLNTCSMEYLQLYFVTTRLTITGLQNILESGGAG